MKLQKLLSRTRQALQDYNMISNGDHVAIGVSGGKDSLALLYVLHSLMQFYPEKYQISVITIDLGFGTQDFSRIEAICKELSIPFYLVKTDIASLVFHSEYSESPCYLCSKLRKGALYDKAAELHCNKIALAHHKDDVVETMMMSLIYEGRFHTFDPVTTLERFELTLIRPFIYVNEGDIKGLIYTKNIPVLKSGCPVDGYTHRAYIKQLLNNINQETHGVKNRLFTAIKNSELSGWKNE